MTISRHLALRASTLVVAAALATAQSLHGPGPQPAAGAAAVEALVSDRDGPLVDPGSFRWVRPARVASSGPMEWHPAVFLARPSAGESLDLFAADFRVTSGGEPREARRLVDISRAADTSEDVLAAHGEGRVAYGTRSEKGYIALHLVDFAGEPRDLTAGWPTAWRLANRVTNFQRTGRARGLARTSYVFARPPRKLKIDFDQSGRLRVRTERESFSIAPDGTTDSPAVVIKEQVKGRPALIAWAVDTARAVSWIGPEGIEWLEMHWFDLRDRLARLEYDLLGAERRGAEQIDYSGASVTRNRSGVPGWPPERLEPQLKRPAEGEGVWVPVNDGVFTPRTSGPPLFFETFLRVDPERPFAPVYMTAWDPALVDLRIMAGTVEPLSTTGMTGEGQVPRRSGDGMDVSRLVGAFNGAFQALHGEWGMMLDGRVFLPPKPYAATVARFEDDIVAMGTWPQPAGEIPERMVDMRQNVNPLVEDGELNPYRRYWWGGVPEEYEDPIYTVRSGICLTFGGKLVYLWGEHQGPETLGKAMIAAGCDYGIHLDMNAGHCGFEYYRVDPRGECPELERRLRRSMEAEGLVPRREELAYRSRKRVREMAHMRFPRYIGRDPRDFFYLLRKPAIFDNPPEGLAGEWIPRGARKGYPVPVLTGEMGGGAEIVKVDSGQVSFRISDEPPDDAPLVIPFSTAASGIETGLRAGGEELRPLQSGEPAIGFAGGSVTAFDPEDTVFGETVIQGVPAAVAEMLGVRHALGVDPEGHLLVAVGEVGQRKLAETLEDARAGTVAFLPPPEAGDPDHVYYLVGRLEGEKPWRRIFPDVEPVSPSEWRRVYRRRGKLLDHDQ
ncbi:MAG: hypothetical protein R6V85_17000 [Polyangia bacterium]